MIVFAFPTGQQAFPKHLKGAAMPLVPSVWRHQTRIATSLGFPLAATPKRVPTSTNKTWLPAYNPKKGAINETHITYSSLSGCLKRCHAFCRLAVSFRRRGRGLQLVAGHLDVARHRARRLCGQILQGKRHEDANRPGRTSWFLFVCFFLFIVKQKTQL